MSDEYLYETYATKEELEAFAILCGEKTIPIGGNKQHYTKMIVRVMDRAMPGHEKL